ncbi:MAG: autotransporter outer membrane beta-barrel domain-containing protein [Puniceicoccales bacterium]|jgi:outer membrane autotransporter protein|nr:autotransporter outer membrane beta-barrel domain-containing protein [Puniceicoccales bacterium]
MELGLGVTWETRESGQFYADYEYIRGERYEIPWKVNVGYRLQW